MLLRASLWRSLKLSLCPADVDWLLVDAVTLVLYGVLIPRGFLVFLRARFSFQGGVGILVECDSILGHPSRCEAWVHLLLRSPWGLPKCTWETRTLLVWHARQPMLWKNALGVNFRHIIYNAYSGIYCLSKLVDLWCHIVLLKHVVKLRIQQRHR